MAALAAQDGVSLPSLNKIRQQIAASMTRDGKLGSTSSEAIGISMQPGFRAKPASDLRLEGRRVAVVTTAALPWMTGTSINPLLRAAHLASKGYTVSLLLPWIDISQQRLLFPSGVTFDEPRQQEHWIREWLRELRVVSNLEALEERLSLRWYPAIYEQFLGAIIQRSGVDLATTLPPAERDVAILEEPEHINWYHHGEQWTSAFSHVVGVLHTNYVYYAQYEERSGGAGEIPPAARAVIMGSLNSLVCQAYLDVGIKLSAALPDVPGASSVCNVHGVRADFLAVGAAMAELSEEERDETFSAGAYFLGKALWTKGYRLLFDELRRCVAAGEVRLADVPSIHTYGSGRDEAEIRSFVDATELPVEMHAATDHANPRLHAYRVFVNPSTSEVLCTATAEALAMGKAVLIPRHPSNVFFEQFSNAVVYDESTQLLPLLLDTLAKPPRPMTAKEQYLLSWEAATERLLDAALLPEEAPAARDSPLHGLAYQAHYALGVGSLDDYFRENSGATVGTRWPAERVASLSQSAGSSKIVVSQ